MLLINLTKVLKVLSASVEEQVQHLKELGTLPSTDELSLEFDDIYLTYKGSDAQKRMIIESMNY